MVDRHPGWREQLGIFIAVGSGIGLAIGDLVAEGLGVAFGVAFGAAAGVVIGSVYQGSRRMLGIPIYLYLRWRRQPDRIPLRTEHVAIPEIEPDSSKEEVMTTR